MKGQLGKVNVPNASVVRYNTGKIPVYRFSASEGGAAGVRSGWQEIRKRK